MDGLPADWPTGLKAREGTLRCTLTSAKNQCTLGRCQWTRPGGDAVDFPGSQGRQPCSRRHPSHPSHPPPRAPQPPTDDDRHVDTDTSTDTDPAYAPRTILRSTERSFRGDQNVQRVCLSDAGSSGWHGLAASLQFAAARRRAAAATGGVRCRRPAAERTNRWQGDEADGSSERRGRGWRVGSTGAPAQICHAASPRVGGGGTGTGDGARAGGD